MISSLLKIGLISLGLAVSSSTSVLAVNSFCCGLINSILFKKKELKVKIISLILLSGLIFLISIKNSWDLKGAFLSWFLILTGAWLGALIKNNLRALVLLACLTLGYLLVAFIDGRPIRQVVKQEPIYDRYRTDMKSYLKTYYLLEKGVSFYEAYAIGEKGDAFTDNYPGEIWGWKTPFLFYFWKIFPGKDGRTIYWLFLSLVLTTPFAAFLIGKELVGEKHAFLSSFLLWPYFLLPLKEITFIQVEWWGLVFFLWGFYFLIKDKLFWTGFFMALTLFSRELFIVHLFFIGLVLFFSKKRKAFLAVFTPFLLLAAFYLLVHIPQVGKYEDLQKLSSWLRTSQAQFSLEGVKRSLAFNSNNYLLTSFFPFRWSLIVSSLCLFFLFLKQKKIKYLLALVSFLPFFFIQFKPGMMTHYHDYWGIYYIPLTLLFLPGIIKAVRLKNKC